MNEGKKHSNASYRHIDDVTLLLDLASVGSNGKPQMYRKGNMGWRV